MTAMPRSIRGRIALVAAFTSTIGAIILALMFSAVVSSDVLDRARADVRAEVDNLVVQLGLGMSPEDLPLETSADGTLVRLTDQTTGQVIAMSPIVEAERTADENSRRLDVTVRTDPSFFPAGSRLLVSATAQTRFGPVLVEAARNDTFVDVTRDSVLRNAALVSPVGIAAVTLLAWVLAGRALSPVATMTEQASKIDDLHRGDRIPVPDTSDEIAQLADVLNQMLGRFEEARTREEALVSDVAHELRTPLAALRTRIDAAMGDAPESAHLAAASGQVDRLGALIRGVLDVSRLEDSTRTTPEERSIDLGQLVQRALVDYQPNRVSMEVAPMAAPVRGDPELLTRVVTNLVDNALYHGATRVHARVTASNGHCHLRVDDDGPGIAPHDRVRVFDRFVQLDESRSAGHGGVGLGLAIVRATVNRYGGVVTIGDGELGGARFDVELPRASGDLSEDRNSD